MKKHYRIPFFIIIFLIVLGVLVWIFIKKFPIQTLSLYSYIKNPPPVVWNNIQVSYKYGMHYYTYENSILFSYWGLEQNEGLSIACNVKPARKLTENNRDIDSKYELISVTPSIINNMGVIVEEKIDKETKEYYYIIRFVDFPIAIGYNGPRERFAAYEHVIYSVKVLDAQK